MAVVVAYGTCYQTMPAGVWHFECLACGFRFVQGDEDMYWAHGRPHFKCPRCHEPMEVLD